MKFDRDHAWYIFYRNTQDRTPIQLDPAFKPKRVRIRTFSWKCKTCSSVVTLESGMKPNKMNFLLRCKEVFVKNVLDR